MLYSHLWIKSPAKIPRPTLLDLHLITSYNGEFLISHSLQKYLKVTRVKMTHSQPHTVSNAPSDTHSDGLVCPFFKPPSNLRTPANTFNTSSFHNSLRKPTLPPWPAFTFQGPVGLPCPCVASPEDKEPGAGTEEAERII